MADLINLDSGLRAWQVDAIKEWESSHHRGMIEVVTGGGKTRFALAATYRWLTSNSVDSAVAIIVPTTALQDQWYVNLVSDLGVRKLINRFC